MTSLSLQIYNDDDDVPPRRVHRSIISHVADDQYDYR